jgi:exodeoxyribonuclease VII small subunit
MSPHDPQKKSAHDPATFEEAIERLEALVSEMETGDIPLEKSLLAFEEGQRLIKFCEQKLKTAEESLKQLAQEAKDALGENSLRDPS